jgi:hypothetical protein
MKVVELKLSLIKDGGAQMRVGMNPTTILDYAEDMLRGDEFPPVVVFFDKSDHWLGEGFHRVEAARKVGRETIKAEVRPGTSRDAILFGIQANATHGLRRSQADKRKAVEVLLHDATWAKWSDRKIAEAAKVDHKTVGKIRGELSGDFPTKPDGKGGEIPTRDRMQNRGSILERVLQSLSDEVLIAECQRRGLTNV